MFEGLLKITLDGILFANDAEPADFNMVGWLRSREPKGAEPERGQI